MHCYNTMEDDSRESIASRYLREDHRSSAKRRALVHPAYTVDSMHGVWRCFGDKNAPSMYSAIIVWVCPPTESGFTNRNANLNSTTFLFEPLFAFCSIGRYKYSAQRLCLLRCFRLQAQLSGSRADLIVMLMVTHCEAKGKYRGVSCRTRAVL